jgi:putative Ca2+/H+ antiporter (TMEM165/GDT1 family)
VERHRQRAGRRDQPLRAGHVDAAVGREQPEDDAGGAERQRFGVFGTTVVAFFLAEMGDKTQLATVALAARYADLLAVVLGTTLGLLLANVPVVFLGDRLLRRVSMKWVHVAAALLFVAMGLLALFNVGGVMGS